MEIEYFLEQGRADDILLLVTEGAEPALHPEKVFPEPIVRAGLHRRIYYDLRGKRHRRNKNWRGVRDFQDELTRFTADLYGQAAGDLYPTWQRQRLLRKRALVSALVAAGILVAALASYWAWSRTNAFQIRTLIADSAGLVPAVNENAAYDWVQLLGRTGRKDAAEVQAGLLPDPEYRAKALAYAAVGSAQSPNPDPAFVTRLTANAQRLAEGVSDPYGRSEIFIIISDALTGIRKFDDARASLDRAIVSALSVDAPAMRTLAILNLSDARYYRHDRAAAARQARRLDELSKSESDQQQKATALASAAMLSSLAREPDFNDRVTAALQAAQAIPAKRIRADTLADIAGKFADAEMHPAAGRAAAASLSAAQSLEGSVRSFVLTTQVFPVLRRLGAKQAIARSLATVQRDLTAETDADSKIRSIGQVLPWMIDFGFRREAERLFAEASTALGQIEDPDRRIDMSSELAHQGSKAELPEAERLLKTAMALIPRHTDDRGRSVACAQAAAGWAELGDFRRARLLGLTCESSDDRLSVYESILEQTLPKKDPSDSPD